MNETDAANYLGITKELLNSFARVGYFGQKLKLNSDPNNNFYSVKNLKEFDLYMHLPLTNTCGVKKPTIPSFIREYLKIESRGKCARCGTGHRLDNAHIEPWSISFSHHPHNLIRLCTDCHTKFDDNLISKDEIIILKNSLIQRIKEDNIEIDLSIKNIRLPKLTRNFIGRFQELESLDSLFFKNNLICIEGIGGIGKTQLLLKFIEKKKIDVSWFNLESFFDFQDFVTKLFTKFQSKDLREFLIAVEKQSAVLIFDGMEVLWNKSQDKTTEFLKFLHDNTIKCKVIFTSQFNFLEFDTDLSIIKLKKGLSQNETFELLKDKNPSLEFTNHHVQELIKFSDGHPLTIKIISGLIFMFKSAEKVWNSIKEIGISVIQNPNIKVQNKSTSLEIALSIVFNNLNEKQKWLLMYLALFPVGCKEHALEILIIKKDDISTFQNSSELILSLSVLSLYNLIDREMDYLEITKIKILNPVRIYIGTKFGENKELLNEVQISAFQNSSLDAITLYKTYMLSDNIDYGMMRYEVELPNYLYALKRSIHSAYCENCKKYYDGVSYLRIITNFSLGLYKYLFTRGLFQYGISINKQGAKAHAELKEFDLAIDDLTQVATLYNRIGNVVEAQKALNEMQKYESLSGKRFSSVRYVEGELLQEEKPYEAIKTFEEGIEICENNLIINPVDSSVQNNMAAILTEIAKTYEIYIYDYNTALNFYRKGYKITKNLKDYTNMLCNSHHIGNCHFNLGNYAKSLEYYKESFTGFVKYGQQEYIGNSLSQIGSLRISNPELNYSFLTKELLMAGLNDVNFEIISGSISKKKMGGNNLNGGLENYLIYKYWRTINAISLSKHSIILKTWAKDFIEFLKSNHILESSYPFKFAEIAILLIELEYDRNNLDKLSELKYKCYLFGSEVEHDIFEPFSFLSLWLKEKNIENISRRELFLEIENGQIDDDYDD